ncbi:MAG: hypothetical protein Q4D30_02255 [Bacteroidales bacterium]|nr:hypothetical protein [Bacteroidales bacterium]
MIENIKTEKWNSLRLELQQFVAQEFVANCYWFECMPNTSHPYFTTTEAGNGDKVFPDEDFSNHQHHFADKEVTTTTPSTYEGYLYASLHKKGYVTGNPTHVRYIQVGGDYHIGIWRDMTAQSANAS